MKPPPDKQHILDSILAIASRTGRAPSRSEFLSLSKISEHQVLRFFPKWNDAVRAAGLIPHTINVRLEDRDLLEDWAFVVRTKGKIPARRAYPHLGQYDPRTFRRFGPWSNLPEVFRNFAKDKPEYADVLALLPAPKPSPKPPCPEPAGGPVGARLVHPERSRRAPPASRAPNHKSPSSLLPNHAQHRQSPSAPSPAKVRYPPLHGRPSYGQPFDFRGLRHEPINELGVVVLFGLVAKELGYTVESVQSGFPDCEAKRQIAPQRWQRVHIEFEFESRNFRDHGHPFTGCDVIVCWRHNWPDCPPQIEILELSSVIKSLPSSPDD
ncbi:MAG TPA: hypothetical protein VFI60_08500 [Candidatus Acidoferrum sp.]|nr:hypothetical protein [Candidatus Acidoferrum sp.]